MILVDVRKRASESALCSACR